MYYATAVLLINGMSDADDNLDDSPMDANNQEPVCLFIPVARPRYPHRDHRSVNLNLISRFSSRRHTGELKRKLLELSIQFNTRH